MMLPNDESLFGYHFIPTEIEMLKILERRIEGKSIPSVVIKRNMYGENQEVSPWNIFKEDDPWQVFFDSDGSKLTKGSKVLYIITKLKKMGEKKTHRVAGLGCWSGQTRRTDIYDYHRNKIGFRSMFNYRVKDGFRAAGNWIMHEYHLNGNSTDYVICKIKRSGDKLVFDNNRNNSQQQISKESQESIPGNQESIESGMPLEVRQWTSGFEIRNYKLISVNYDNKNTSGILQTDGESNIQEQDPKKKRRYSDCSSEGGGEICPKEKQLKLVEDPNTAEENELSEFKEWSVDELETLLAMY